jgi:hypothetical protein
MKTTAGGAAVTREATPSMSTATTAGTNDRMAVGPSAGTPDGDQAHHEA